MVQSTELDAFVASKTPQTKVEEYRKDKYKISLDDRRKVQKDDLGSSLI